MAESFPKFEAQPELPGYDPYRPLKVALKFIVIITISLAIIFAIWKMFKVVQIRTSFRAHQKRALMGTTVEIKAYGKDARSASKQALQAMERMAKLINAHDTKSEIGLVNSMAGIASVAVSRNTFDVIYRSIKLSKSMGNTFDITIGPLIELWNFKGKDTFTPPSSSQIKETLKLVDYRKIEIDPEIETIKLLKRGMKINLGGVGKGYVLAIGRSMLVSKGIKSGLISSGSSITCIGTKPDGEPWRVGIRSPRDPEKLLGTITLAPGQAVSTSGDYEQYVEIEGKRYHHIFDPRTGYPASSCQSVTIIAGDATIADILSTSVFVMGPWRGMRLLRTLENVEGLIVDSSGKVHKTTGFKLEILKEETKKQ